MKLADDIMLGGFINAAEDQDFIEHELNGLET